MKTYEIAMHRTESITVKLEAESPQRAIELAREGHSLFHTDACVSLDEDGEAEDAYEILGECEQCRKMVFDESEHNKGIVCDDGEFFCEACYAAMTQAPALHPSREPQARKEGE